MTTNRPVTKDTLLLRARRTLRGLVADVLALLALGALFIAAVCR